MALAPRALGRDDNIMGGGTMTFSKGFLKAFARRFEGFPKGVLKAFAMFFLIFFKGLHKSF
jgi:hypothetical protein